MANTYDARESAPSPEEDDIEGLITELFGHFIVEAKHAGTLEDLLKHAFSEADDMELLARLLKDIDIELF